MYFTKEFYHHIHDCVKQLRKTALNCEKKTESKLYLE